MTAHVQMVGPDPRPTVSVADDGSAVYVQWDNRPTYRLMDNGSLTEQWRAAPDLPDELLTFDDVLEHLQSVKLTKAARTTLAERLGCDPDDLRGAA